MQFEIYYLFEFLFYYFILAIGDFSLYHVSNFIHDISIKKNTRVSKFEPLPLQEWVFGNSVSYTFIYLIYTKKTGYLYFSINEYNIFYTVISPILYLLLQDFIFYFMHRLVHTPMMYKKIHYIHHKFRYPTSWAGRISNVIDSNLENIAFTFPALVLPINIYLWQMCLVFSSFWGNFLHDSTNKISIPYLNDNTDHCLHHYYGEQNCNFAYYFNHCDKFFGTYKKLKVNCKKKISQNMLKYD